MKIPLQRLVTFLNIPRSTRMLLGCGMIPIAMILLKSGYDLSALIWAVAGGAMVFL